jgi:peptidoglycan hydrolase CwlO-like protein
MAELKDVLSDIIKAQDKTVSALKENRTKINNSVSSLNGAVGDVNIENI